MALAYIADSTGANKVYLEIDPAPVPYPKYEVAGSKKRTLNTKDGSDNIIPGQWHHYLGGTHSSGSTIEVRVQFMSRSTFSNILTKITGSGMGQVKFSPDNGTTVYNCVFAPGEIAINPIDGTDILEGSLKFNLI